MSDPDDPKNQPPPLTLSLDGAPPPVNKDNVLPPEQTPVDENAEAKPETENLDNLISAAFSDILANAPKQKPQDVLRYNPGNNSHAGLFSVGVDQQDAGDIEASMQGKPLMIGNVDLQDYLNPWRILTALGVFFFLTFTVLYLHPPVWFKPIRTQIQQGLVALRQAASGKITVTQALEEVKQSFAKLPTNNNMVVAENLAGKDREKAAVGPGACQLRIAALLQQTNAGKVAVADALSAAQCYLVLDDPQRAYALVRTFHERLPRRTNSSMDLVAGMSPENRAGFWLELQTLARLGQYEVLEQVVRPLCSQWVNSAECVAKLYYLNAANHVPTARTAIQKISSDKQRTLTGTSALMLALVSGEVADKAGDYAGAAKYFSDGRRLAANESIFYRKALLEAHAYAASRHENIADLAKVQQQSSAMLAEEGRVARTKILLVAAMHSKSAGDVLKNILARNDMNMRLRGDNRLLGILGETAVRRNQAPAFVKYAQANTDHLRISYKASPAAVFASEQWRMRGLIAAGKSREALPVIDEMLRASPKSALTWHLKGVALDTVWQSKSPGLSGAEKAFATAATLRPHWQSFLAFAEVAGKNGDFTKQRAALDKAKSVAVGDMAQFWLKIGEIKWHLAKGSVNQALAASNHLSPSEKETVVAQTLRISILRELRQGGEAQEIEQKLDVQRKSVDYARSKEIKSNPLGPLALL